MMLNAFLVIRTVFFALLAYIHVLILLFASWNIIAAKHSGTSMPGASVLLLMSSVLVFVLVPIAYLADLVCLKAWVAHVRVECVWTVLMSLFQLAVSICVTVNGPPMYCWAQSLWAMCASSSLLAHLTWLATFTIVSYCLTICITASAHATHLPNIWRTSISQVPWFRPETESSTPVGNSHSFDRKHSHVSAASSWSEVSCALSKYIAERWEKLSPTERKSIQTGAFLLPSPRGSPSADSRPTWAYQHGVRRGVDIPFARPLPKRKAPPVMLSPPPRSQSLSRHALLSATFRSASEGTCSDSTLTPRSSIVFPQKASDLDLPGLIPASSDRECADADLESIPLP